MLLHEWKKFLGGPSLGLEVIVIRRRSTGIHHKVDGGATTEDVCAWHDGFAASQPFGRAGVIEGGSLAVQLHVAWVYCRPVDPWVVQVALSSLDQ
jgi:hypothetical protein